jgi:hypothetical protein
MRAGGGPGTGFHALWHYVNFIVYIRERDRTEMTGPEQYVYQCLQTRDHRCAVAQARGGARCVD